MGPDDRQPICAGWGTRQRVAEVRADLDLGSDRIDRDAIWTAKRAAFALLWPVARTDPARVADVASYRAREGKGQAHANGMPVTSHEIYPAVASGADGVEHIRGTSRRGYSPKVTALFRSYQDVENISEDSGDEGLTLTAGRLAFTHQPGIVGRAEQFA